MKFDWNDVTVAMGAVVVITLAGLAVSCITQNIPKEVWAMAGAAITGILGLARGRREGK